VRKSIVPLVDFYLVLALYAGPAISRNKIINKPDHSRRFADYKAPNAASGTPHYRNTLYRTCTGLYNDKNNLLL
jgi:hypothetical protein